MKLHKLIIYFSFYLMLCFNCYSQSTDSIFALKAFRPGMQINSKTGDTTDFRLCGDDVTTDSLRFFSIIRGCERNVSLRLGKYTFRNDTFLITPFDFLKETPFLNIFKTRSNSRLQTITFVSADYQELKGLDSSWIVKCFKRRKDKYFDFSSDGVVKLQRGKYDGMELLQLTKIFGGPIVFFLNKKFDYLVRVNIPSAPLKRFILGGSGLEGVYFIKDDLLFTINSTDGFKIGESSRK